MHIIPKGWKKPFNWTETYIKEDLIVKALYNSRDCKKIDYWHLERLGRNQSKHYGNYPTLTLACNAGDAMLSLRDGKVVN